MADAERQVDRVDEKTLVLAPSISWRPNDESDITLLLNYTDTESDTAQQFLPIAGTLYPAANGRRIDSKTYLGEPDFNRFDPSSTSVTPKVEGRRMLELPWTCKQTPGAYPEHPC